MSASTVVGPAYVRMMAAYNAEMNRRLYAAAGRLSDAQRRENRGAFWGSIHGTFSHLIWGDHIWMSRFDGWNRPSFTAKQAADMYADHATLLAARTEADARISDWANRVDQSWLGQDLTWFSGAAAREITLPRGILMTHFFNHQTHHRGQAHALITSFGEDTGDTDLMIIPQAIEAGLRN
ncbi:MAG: DinB family protein [Micropepsaceae bacterium]